MNDTSISATAPDVGPVIAEPTSQLRLLHQKARFLGQDQFVLQQLWSIRANNSQRFEWRKVPVVAEE